MMKIINADCYTNYGTVISSKIIGTDDDVKDFEALVGKTIGFGEYEGKHSDVEGQIRLEDIRTTAIPEEDARVLLNHIGKRISGEDYFNYYDVGEEHYGVLAAIVGALSDDLKDKVATWVQANNRYVREVSDYNRVDALGKLLPFHLILEWEKELEEDDEGNETLSEETLAIIIERLRAKLEKE